MCCGMSSSRGASRAVSAAAVPRNPRVTPLAGVATGNLVTLLYTGDEAPVHLANVPSGASYRLKGDKTFIAYARDVDALLERVDESENPLFEKVNHAKKET